MTTDTHPAFRVKFRVLNENSYVLIRFWRDFVGRCRLRLQKLDVSAESDTYVKGSRMGNEYGTSNRNSCLRKIRLTLALLKIKVIAF